MVRSFALALSLPLVVVGCVAHTHETPSSSMTSTTQSTSAAVPSDPHFLVSDRIYESCQLATQTAMDVAEGTAHCLKTGALNQKRVRVMGSREEVENAKARLIGHGVDINRIVTVYEDGPATIDVIENSLGKKRRY